MRTRESKLLVFLIIISVFLLITIICIRLNRGTKEISLSPDFYLINPPGTADGETPEMSKDDVQSISKTISGKYKNKKERESVVGEFMYSVLPGYLNIVNANDIDDYAVSSSTGKGPNGETVVYGEEILILDKRTIAFRDVETGGYWIGKKKGDPIDLDIIKAFLPAEKADSAGDDSATEAEPETSESIVQNRN